MCYSWIPWSDFGFKFLVVTFASCASLRSGVTVDLGLIFCFVLTEPGYKFMYAWLHLTTVVASLAQLQHTTSFVGGPSEGIGHEAVSSCLG